MSYSSAAQLDISSASVKLFMKCSMQEWADVLRGVPAMGLLTHTHSCFWGQSHALQEGEHRPMSRLLCLRSVFQPATRGTSI